MNQRHGQHCLGSDFDFDPAASAIVRPAASVPTTSPLGHLKSTRGLWAWMQESENKAVVLDG